MFDGYTLKDKLSWASCRTQLCTAAVCMSYTSLWRAGREALRYGGLPYLLLLTATTALVALPVSLLHLALGQLSQQDAVGIWRAVPFFKGIGYLRLVISVMASLYTSVYVALSASYFMYTLRHEVPFTECTDHSQTVVAEVTNSTYSNVDAAGCLDETFMASISGKPEYFIAMAFVIIAIWIVLPFLLYKPVQMMRKLFYFIGPVIILLCLIIGFSIGSGTNMAFIHNWDYWGNVVSPNIWHSVVVQALWVGHTAGGYLVLAGDTVYSNTNVQWSSLIFVGANLLSNWVGVLFWYAVGGASTHDSPVVVLLHTYEAAELNNFSVAWPLLIYAMLFFSGVVTLCVLVYPVYDRYCRIGDHKWRWCSVGHSLGCAGAALALYAGRLPALSALDDAAVPFLVVFVTVLELFAFVYIYGCKILLEDVEFLAGSQVTQYWVYGWHVSPVIILAFTLWWLVKKFSSPTWVDPPWSDSAIVVAAALFAIVFITFAVVAIVKQVQYDFTSKLLSSFKPTRHWGPRDPITHYYWLARREEADNDKVSTTRYQSRQFGQLSVISSYADLPQAVNTENELLPAYFQKRTNSDDWLYTGMRRKYIEDVYKEYFVSETKRSVSLDLSSNKGAISRSSGEKSRSSSYVVSKQHLVMIHQEKL